MGRMAKRRLGWLTGLVKGAYDAEAGVVNATLDSAWKKDFWTGSTSQSH